MLHTLQYLASSESNVKSLVIQSNLSKLRRVWPDIWRGASLKMSISGMVRVAQSSGIDIKSFWLLSIFFKRSSLLVAEARRHVLAHNIEDLMGSGISDSCLRHVCQAGLNLDSAKTSKVPISKLNGRLPAEPENGPNARVS
jgi:hypothetical protein